MHDVGTVPEIWCMTDDRQKHKQKKWLIEVGAPTKKLVLSQRFYIILSLKGKCTTFKGTVMQMQII